MKSNFKRFVGITLATLLVATMIPLTAFAENTTGATAPESPNVFSVVADATGNQQTEYLLADTLEQGGQTYYGLMTRKNLNVWYGDIKAGGTSLKPMDDTSKKSTDTAKYVKYQYHMTGASFTDVDNLLATVYPAAVQPYAQELEMQIATDTSNANVKYYATGKMFPPLAATVDANKDFISLPLENKNKENDGSSFRGLITRSPSGWRDDWTYFASKFQGKDTGVYETGYAHLGATYYTYYWTPVIYVTKDFFRNIKIDMTKEIGANVKTFLTENFNTMDLMGIYTADEMTQLKIPEMPNPAGDTFVVGGVTYYMVPNTTVEYKGETYVGVMRDTQLISWGTAAAANNAGYFEITGTKEDGSVVGKLLRGHTSKTDIQTYASTYFGGFDGYLVDGDYEWSMGQARVNETDTANTKLYGKGTISLPSHTEWEALHANSDAFNNGTGWLARNISFMGTGYEKQWRLFKSGESKNTNANRVTDSEGKVTAFDTGTQYAHWSLMTMVKEDFFLENKLDLATTSSNVRAFLANYKQTDFTADYSKNEFAVLGITEFDEEVKVEADAKTNFTVGGETFYYLNSVIEHNGKKYFKVFDNKDWVTWGSQDAYYLVSERPEGGVYLTVKHASTTGKDLQEHDTNFGLFGGNEISADYEWSFGNVNYNGASTPAYVKGSISVPSSTDYEFLLNQGVTFTDQGAHIIASDLFLEHDGTSRRHVYSNQMSSFNLEYVPDGNYYKGLKNARYNYVTYISEDFFKENDIDMTNVGGNFKKMLAENFDRSDLTGWTKANLDILFGDYNGEGIGLVATKTANGAEVVIHNNGTEAAGAGATLIVASYDADGMVDVKKYVLKNNVSAGSKTSAIAFNLDMTGATFVKAMLWEDVLSAKPLASASTAK